MGIYITVGAKMCGYSLRCLFVLITHVCRSPLLLVISTVGVVVVAPYDHVTIYYLVSLLIIV